jgi:ABC-type uncharacterized transport system auxiliary subunit
VRAWSLVALVALAACARPPQRRYYTLNAADPGTRFEAPFPVTLQVRDLDMRRSYRRDELVFRSDAHELTFARSRRWSEPPQRMISSIVREQVRRSNIATVMATDAVALEPDYVLGGSIDAIEQLNVGRERHAHLAVTLRLSRFKDDVTVWTYRIDARKPVAGASVRGTVRTMSELLSQETDRALADLGRWFTDPEGHASAQPEVALAAPAQAGDGVVGPDDEAALRHVSGLARDDTPVPPGLGAIFAPSLSDGDREPRAGVYRAGEVVATGQLGERIVVAPGEYEVRVGSGAVSQQTVTRVLVAPGRTTVIPPVWAALDVAVVDETFIPFRGTYELIRMTSREDFGLGFGADEQLGEDTRVWVLPPGLYKLIRAGGTYRDRTDFATVRLDAGNLTRFTLVVDPDTGRFLGAGEDEGTPDSDGDEDDEDRGLTLRAVLGGDLNFNRSDLVGEQEGWKLSFRVFFDGSVRFVTGPHSWFTRLELEEGQTRLLAQDRFQSDTDRLFLHSIYTYHLFSWFGPYARVGLETKLLPRHENFDMPREVVELDAAGAVVDTRTVDRVRLGGAFAPLQLKQGAGGNFRVLRTRVVELDLRVGFGARQTVANGLFVFEDGTPGQLVPIANASIAGAEATILGLGRLTNSITISTELDGLAPFSDDAVVFTWRNQATLRLASFLSLNYRFNVVRDPNLGIGGAARTEHDVQLRFSYVLF